MQGQRQERPLPIPGMPHGALVVSAGGVLGAWRWGTGGRKGGW